MPKPYNSKLLLALLIAMSLAGCATPSTPTPVVLPPVDLPPLPQSVTKIDSTDSQGYLTKVSNWLKKVEALSNAGTPK